MQLLSQLQDVMYKGLAISLYLDYEGNVIEI